MMRVDLTSGCLQVECDALQAAGVLLTGPLQLKLQACQLNVLRGANGVGKSTLLRAIANVLPGQAVLFKSDYGLRDELLVREHLQIVLMHLYSSADRLDGLLAEVGLSDWQHERVGTLSSGQRARLGLCTLLAAPFKLWLLDEPLNALDLEGQAVLGKALARHFQGGGLVFMATHVDPAMLLQHLPGVVVRLLVLENARLQGESCVLHAHRVSVVHEALNRKVPLTALLKRDWALVWGNPQALLWGALFHWMVLSFFGIGLGKTSVEFAQVAMWVSLLLATMLAAKDWFIEDHRVGWIRLVFSIHCGSVANYWLVRVLFMAMSQIAVMVPVTGLVSLQFGLSGEQSIDLMQAMVAGIWATGPLLGLIALLTMLTRGGAVLVYLLALPLLVPVLIFGLEASQAAGLGRSAMAPLAVLWSLGLLLCLVGPLIARRLVQLIQE